MKHNPCFCLSIFLFAHPHAWTYGTVYMQKNFWGGGRGVGGVDLFEDLSDSRHGVFLELKTVKRM